MTLPGVTINVFTADWETPCPVEAITSIFLCNSFEFAVTVDSDLFPCPDENLYTYYGSVVILAVAGLDVPDEVWERARELSEFHSFLSD